MANRTIGDLLGTALSAFLIGLGSTAVRLKNVSGVLRIRNKADNADSNVVAGKVSVSGEAIQLNEDAAGSGADWTYDVERPTTGQGEARRLVLPAGNPAVGQAITVSAYAAGVVETTYTTVAGGSDKPVVDTTTVGFGASSPVAMFTKPANAVSMRARIIVDTAFDGAPSISIGIAGSTSKFVPSTAVDLTAAGIYEYDMSDVAAVGTTEDVIATYSAGGATQGSARVLFEYVVPS